MTDSPQPPKRKTVSRDASSRKPKSPPKSPARKGVLRVFQTDSQQDDSSRARPRAATSNGKSTELNLPAGPVTQVYSPRLRRNMDTFLMNTTPVLTSFRAFLEGPDGGYQGDLTGSAVAYVEGDKIIAASAILNDNGWLLHATDKKALNRMLDTLLEKLIPMSIEGEAQTVLQALKHPKLAALPNIQTRQCVHLELTSKRIPHGTAGHHRFAQMSDLPRLEQYAKEYEAELEETPPDDWRTLTAENRILLGIQEGTIASVAQRGPTTLDSMSVVGVYTFKPYRRHGMAKGLVVALARQAAGRDQVASAIVGKGNGPMLALLEGLAFNKTTEYLIAVFSKKVKEEA